ncbi:MAG TPA: protein kinase [Anaerolineae bacterium]|nr:protein kinase [Anaerolineae bacterium]
MDPSSELARHLFDLLDRSLQAIWDGDADAYAALTAEDVSFFEWYISPVRIDGLDFHLREILVHRAAWAGVEDLVGLRIEHEVLQPRIQVYGKTAILTYTLFVRVLQGTRVQHLSHNETRVFHNFGEEDAWDWKLVHCHKSPIVTAGSAGVVRG